MSYMNFLCNALDEIIFHNTYPVYSLTCILSEKFNSTCYVIPISCISGRHPCLGPGQFSCT